MRTGDIPAADELAVYAGRDGEGMLYGDGGDGYAYEDGVYTRVRLQWKDNVRKLTLHKAEGTAGLAARMKTQSVHSRTAGRRWKASATAAMR